MAKVFPDFIPNSDTSLTIPGFSFPERNCSSAEAADQSPEWLVLKAKADSLVEELKARFTTLKDSNDKVAQRIESQSFASEKYLNAAGLNLETIKGSFCAQCCINILVQVIVKYQRSFRGAVEGFGLFKTCLEIAKGVMWIDSLKVDVRKLLAFIAPRFEKEHQLYLTLNDNDFIIQHAVNVFDAVNRNTNEITTIYEGGNGFKATFVYSDFDECTTESLIASLLSKQAEHLQS